MTTYAMGVDFGSTTAKTIILDEHGNIVASCIESMGAVSDEGVKASIAGALKQLLDVSQKSYTEITCHARGAVALVPDARLVIDIGGQDSKVIAVDANGLVETFAMNDRCAAGTGKFLEVLARAVEIKLPEMGPLAMQATQALKISSMCATFAETEVISLLAEGHSKPDVLGAVHAAIASRTAGLVGRVVAKNIAAVHHIETSLGQKLVLPPDPQIAGALGAALFALDEIRMAAKRSAVVDEEDRVVDSAMDGARACGPACKSTDAAAAGQVREIVVAPPTLRAAIN